MLWGVTLSQLTACLSLQHKGLLCVGTICLMALLSVGSSLWFAVISDSDAAAINVAGSLRMQSWRLTEQVAVPELSTRQALAKLIDIYDNSINATPLARLYQRDDALGENYRSVLKEWYQKIRPLLLNPESFGAFVASVPEFVDDIDAMVNALQLNSEQKLNQLVMVAVAMLLGIILIAFFAFRFTRRDLLNPLADLAAAAYQIRRGSFSDVSLTYCGNNETGQLTSAFNQMAADLSRLYTSLEEQVGEQTQALAQSNKALELLYRASRQFSVNPYDERMLSAMMADWQQLLGLSSCQLCLSNCADSLKLKKITAASAEFPCPPEACASCLYRRESTADTRQYDFNLRSKRHAFGVMRVSLSEGQSLSEESQQRLQTFAEILGTALHQSSLQMQKQRLLLMEERSVIARELHDSLAQALSYQKIQAVRLKRKLTKKDVYPEVEKVLSDLQEGLNSAYYQLRELLRTFRLTVADGDFENALSQTIDEYRVRETTLTFVLDYQLRYCRVDAHQQIHILQIVREALSNVIRHARATEVFVSCRQTDEGRITILVADNGIGISNIREVSGHYGTTIMHERAASMNGGSLEFLASEMGGVAVRLEFSV